MDVSKNLFGPKKYIKDKTLWPWTNLYYRYVQLIFQIDFPIHQYGLRQFHYFVAPSIAI